MNERLFSKHYTVRKLQREDTDAIFDLCRKNELYYAFCPPPVTKESIMEDMTALPPHTSIEDKYYVGYFSGDKLIALLDLIDGYPENGTVFIGLFMTDVSVQKCGIGTSIISELLEYLTASGIAAVQLAWVKGNPQSEHFWLKNGFIPVKETTSNAAAHVILAERKLS